MRMRLYTGWAVCLRVARIRSTWLADWSALPVKMWVGEFNYCIISPLHLYIYIFQNFPAAIIRCVLTFFFFPWHKGLINSKKIKIHTEKKRYGHCYQPNNFFKHYQFIPKLKASYTFFQFFFSTILTTFGFIMSVELFILFYCTILRQNKAILNLVATICLRKVGTWQQKAGKVRGTTKKQLEEHVATNQCNWQYYSNKIRYKKASQRSRQFLRSKAQRFSNLPKTASTNC